MNIMELHCNKKIVKYAPLYMVNTQNKSIKGDIVKSEWAFLLNLTILYKMLHTEVK